MRITNVRRLPIVVSLALIAITVAAGARLSLSADSEKSVHIGGRVSDPGDWSALRLRAQFAAELKPVRYASKSGKHTSTCVALLSVLKAAGAQTEMKMDPTADPKTKNVPLHLAVVVEGSDGYSAVFSLAELLPKVGGREVWLALDTDGKALSERDGPVKLIVPGDKEPGRWVRNIAAITVVDLADTATPAPAH